MSVFTYLVPPTLEELRAWHSEFRYVKWENLHPLKKEYINKRVHMALQHLLGRKESPELLKEAREICSRMHQAINQDTTDLRIAYMNLRGWGGSIDLDIDVMERTYYAETIKRLPEDYLKALRYDITKSTTLKKYSSLGNA
jgi:hypothetical protein